MITIAEINRGNLFCSIVLHHFQWKLHREQQQIFLYAKGLCCFYPRASDAIAVMYNRANGDANTRAQVLSQHYKEGILQYKSHHTSALRTLRAESMLDYHRSCNLAPAAVKANSRCDEWN